MAAPIPLTQTGQVASVRTRTWRLEGVEENPGLSSTVPLACLYDYAQGE
jgi:hypothetical protein